ncbi:hypothetical protein BDV95DRAFT_205589 [Massariosphaeria phaeospora]|uniref:F-box domain-containing protein n=1 Tax=Massariosphaeria phaeospora TaxID=100035 RepID=A0A7C8M836_9PLEO|nr:hypothetical protein BDV95DRAFT_205589 [Massariosphaeria phaeospora]
MASVTPPPPPASPHDTSAMTSALPLAPTPPTMASQEQQQPRAPRPSLLNLPAEIRLEIFHYVFDLGNTPRAFGYTCYQLPKPKSKDKSSLPQPCVSNPLNNHGMILTNQELSAEYRQCFYERTTFFLQISSHNAFLGAPQLALPSSTPSNPPPPTSPPFPNFWNVPSSLLSSLRHCTLYIELGAIASQPASLHSVSQIVRANTSQADAHLVRQELKTHTSLADIKAQDTAFDIALCAAIGALFAHMQQLRSVKLFWETSVVGGVNTATSTNWTWDTFGVPFVAVLEEKKPLREFQITVGGQEADVVYKAKRREGGKWEGVKTINK